MDALEEFMDVASRVGGHAAADPVVVDAVADAKTVKHHWCKAAEVNGGTGEGASGEDVVVNGAVCRVCVQAVQAPAHWVGQVPQGKQVAVKTLAWWDGRKIVMHSWTYGEFV